MAMMAWIVIQRQATIVNRLSAGILSEVKPTANNGFVVFSARSNIVQSVLACLVCVYSETQVQLSTCHFAFDFMPVYSSNLPRQQR